MDIIEKFSQGKTGDEALNEDRVVITKDFIAVLDGVTSRRGRSIKGMPPGCFATRVIETEIEKLPADIQARAAIDHLITTLKEKSEAAAAEEEQVLAESWAYPASALLMYSRTRREIWRVADSTYAVDGTPNYVFFPQERVWADLRRAWLHSQMARGVTEDTLLDNDASWELLTPIISELKIFANNDGPHSSVYGYGVLNGQVLPEKFLEVIPVSIKAKEIIFASDGYPEVFGTLAETEAALQETVSADPLMYKIHPQVKSVKRGYKSFDDRSYVRFSV